MTSLTYTFFSFHLNRNLDSIRMLPELMCVFVWRLNLRQLEEEEVAWEALSSDKLMRNDFSVPASNPQNKIQLLLHNPLVSLHIPQDKVIEEEGRKKQKEMKVMLSWLMMWCCKQGSLFLAIKEQRLIDFQWCSGLTCWLSQWSLRKGDHVSAQRDKPCVSSGMEDAVTPPPCLSSSPSLPPRLAVQHLSQWPQWIKACFIY